MTQNTPNHAHPLDHLVLPTRDLDVARDRLEALGFTVSPTGVHPFGTVNCCVYFTGGTFMEPLAVGDADAAAMAIAGGNVFVGRDRVYRDHLGDEGFSALVFGTNDADIDHARYVKEGISAGDRLDFSRPFVDPSGKSDTASFRLAFAAAESTPESFVFTCERANAPNVDRSALEAHANGVVGMAEIVAASGNRAAQLDLLRKVAGTGEDAVSQNALGLSNATIRVLDASSFEGRFGSAPKAHSSLSFEAVVFSVRDIKATKTLLEANGVEYRMQGATIVVPPVPGQGAIFAFQGAA